MSEAELTIYLMITTSLLILCLVIFFWQRKYFALVLMRLKNRQVGHSVRIWKNDKTFTDYIVPDASKLDWKKGWMAKLFDDLPEFLTKNILPSVPHARDSRTGFAHYEFNENSRQAIDPYERQPDLQMYEQDSQDYLSAFYRGREFGQLQGNSKFNQLVIALLAFIILLGIANIMISNGMAEQLTKFKEQIDPIIEQAKTLLNNPYFANNLKNLTLPPEGVVGQVKPV